MADREGLTYFHPLRILRSSPGRDPGAGSSGAGAEPGHSARGHRRRGIDQRRGPGCQGDTSLDSYRRNRTDRGCHALRKRQSGRIIELPGIHTRVPTLSALKTEPINLEIVQRFVDHLILIEDDDMRDAARWLWLKWVWPPT